MSHMMMSMPSTLYIVATPIGNLEDITLRALRILREVDVVLAEDTRVTRKLFARYEIMKPLVPFFQHSKRPAIERILGLFEEGKTVALVTCAGTPGISDPGSNLIRAILERFGDVVRIIPVPGPSAVAAIASISAVSMDEFHFFGYPPAKKGRQSYFRDVAQNLFPGILYESPHRILRTLRDLEGAVGSERKVVIGRELTKVFETVYRGSLREVGEKLEKGKPRGEFVVLLEPSKKEKGSGKGA